MLIKKAFHILSLRVIAIGLGFLVQIWMVKSFGSSEYGRFVFFVAVSSVIVVVSKGGLDILLLKHVAVEMDNGARHDVLFAQRSKYLAVGICITFALCFCGEWICRIFVNNSFLSSEQRILLYFSSICVVVFQILLGFERGRERQLTADVYEQAGRSLIMVAVAWILTLATVGEDYVLHWAYAASFAFASMMLYKSFDTPSRMTAASSSANREYSKIGSNSRYTLRQHISFATSGLLGFAFFQMDNLMLASYITPSELGGYNMACNLVRLVIFLPMIVNVVIQPRISVAYEKREYKRLAKIFLSSLFISVSGSLLAMLFLVLFGRYALMQVDASFEGAVPALRVLSLVHVVNSVLIVLASFVQLSNRHADVAKAQIIGAAFTVGLYFYLIPQYGQVGAAWSVFLGLLAVLLVYILMYLKYVKRGYGLLLSQV
jgi:O-antigen/teichoic acid export membrane protein